jgi:hypothetical protein
LIPQRLHACVHPQLFMEVTRAKESMLDALEDEF